MNVLGNIANTAKGAINGVGKILTPPKRTKKQELPDHYHQSSDDYAHYLTMRKTRKY